MFGGIAMLLSLSLILPTCGPGAGALGAYPAAPVFG